MSVSRFESVEALEEMLSLIPKHKGTDKLQADIKRRLSKLRQESKKKTARKTFSYVVEKEGAGQVFVVGPPNVGKSSFVAHNTNASPDVADYPYTTRKPLPGMMRFEDVGKVYHFDATDLPDLMPGQYVVVETARGIQLAQVTGFIPPEKLEGRRYKPITRMATAWPRLLISNVRGSTAPGSMPAFARSSAVM